MMKPQYQIGMMIKSGNTMGIIEALLIAKDYVKYMIENDTFINEIDVEAAFAPVKNKTEVKPVKAKSNKPKKTPTPKVMTDEVNTAGTTDQPSMMN